MSTYVNRIALKLKNAFGDRARIVVDVGVCKCPGCGIDHIIDTQGEGSLDDTAWCEDCDWEGTCRELLTGEKP